MLKHTHSCIQEDRGRVVERRESMGRVGSKRMRPRDRDIAGLEQNRAHLGCLLAGI